MGWREYLFCEGEITNVFQRCKNLAFLETMEKCVCIGKFKVQNEHSIIFGRVPFIHSELHQQKN